MIVGASETCTPSFLEWVGYIESFLCPSRRCGPRSLCNGMQRLVGFFWPKYSNNKNIEGEPGNHIFVVENTAFPTICKTNETVWYILGMEVAWGNLLMEFMGCSSIKTRGIPYGVVRENVKISDEVVDTLERWCRWGSSISRLMVDYIHNIRSSIFHYT